MEYIHIWFCSLPLYEKGKKIPIGFLMELASWQRERKIKYSQNIKKVFRDNDHRFNKSTFHYLNVKRVPMSNIDSSSAFDLGKERR